MHNSDLNNVQIRLQKLRAQYIHELPEKVALLQGLCSDIGDNPDDSVHCREIERLAHSLAGSGTTFGCPDVSSIAREIFTLCQSAVNSDITWKKLLKTRLSLMINNLELSSQRYIERWDNNPSTNSEFLFETQYKRSNKPLAYIVDDDMDFAQAIASAIHEADYEVEIVTTGEELQEAVNNRLPAAIIMDMVLKEGNYAGATTADYYAHEMHIPVIFISIRSDFESRLAAVRAGASAYFVKPIESASVIATLNRLTLKQSQQPYRILWIDDDVELSQLLTQHLASRGMDIKILNNPIGSIDHIQDYQPELIVLDIDMPHINGLELGAVIRQYDEFRHIPIVFLSSDNTLQTRIASMHLGADDFLTKPISPQLLIHALNARLSRARVMREGRLELQRSLRHLEFLQSALDEHAIVSIADIDGRITYVNKKFSELSGYSKEELIGKNHRIVKSGQHETQFYETMWNTIASGKIWHGTIVNRGKDGNLYDVYSTIVPKLDEAGLPEQYVSIRTDVTELRNLERKIKHDAERLSLAMEATNSGLWEWNISSGETFYSSNWRKLLHYTNPAQQISWSSLIHPQDIEKVYNDLFAYLNDKNSVYDCEYRILNGEGNWDWISEVCKVVEYDPDGYPTRIIGAAQLINQRILLEHQKRQIQQQLQHSQKMEAIGHLTSGIAHDFNNLLGGMLGYTELATEILENNYKTEKMKRYLGEINSAGIRAKELISQMLAFSRVSPEQSIENTPPSLLAPIIKEVVHLIRSSIPSRIVVNYNIENDSIMARIQPVQLHQTLLNLVINSRDAIEEYGQIDVSLKKSILSGQCNSCHKNFEGSYAELIIKDTGHGIPEHLFTKIFDPFFTTKDVGKGTGMGLSVVHGIIHALGGHISLRSIEHKETCLHILLPLIDSNGSNTTDNILDCTTAQLGALDGVRIMVVDDEHAISTMLYELFSMHGAIVETFTQSKETLHNFSKNPGLYDLLVTDETMPEMSGLHLSKQILQLRPLFPIILCTGYSEQVDKEIAKSAGVSGFMYKPLETSYLINEAIKLTKNNI